MSFDSLLNKTCKIQELTNTQDSTTGQMVKSWTDKYINVKCRRDQASGGEFESDNSILKRATHIFFMRNNYTIAEGKNRIVFDGKNYNVLLVGDAGGHGHHFEIETELVE